MNMDNLKEISEEDYTEYKKEVTIGQIATMLGKKWDEVINARIELNLESKQYYTIEECKLICDYLINPSKYKNILNDHPSISKQNKKEGNNKTLWLIVGAATAAIGLIVVATPALFMALGQ